MIEVFHLHAILFEISFPFTATSIIKKLKRKGNLLTIVLSATALYFPHGVDNFPTVTSTIKNWKERPIYWLLYYQQLHCTFPMGLRWTSQFDNLHTATSTIKNWKKRAVYWLLYYQQLLGMGKKQRNLTRPTNPFEPFIRSFVGEHIYGRIRI